MDSSLLGTIRRTGGQRQVTYDGRPLYLYIGDNRGEATGQALMGAWYLTTPSGTFDKTPVTSGDG